MFFETFSIAVASCTFKVLLLTTFFPACYRVVIFI